MTRYDFLIETYETERLKTLSVWSQIPDDRMGFRPEPRARTPLEHMVHQCMSEDVWMRTMLGLDIGRPALPPLETRAGFIGHYANGAAERVVLLRGQTDEWFEEPVMFFDVVRSRAWVLTRRFTHSAHHRGQLTVYLRLWGEALYSTYGPTADTGGLFQNGAHVIYRFQSVEDLLARGAQPSSQPRLSEPARLPGPRGSGSQPVTERPDY